MGQASVLEIRTLGGLSIRLGGESVTGLASRKVEALLVYLACNRRQHPREVLAELFWEERAQAQAMANLRVALSSLRKHLKPFVTITRESVALNPEADVQLDVAELEKRLNAGQIEEAVGLYQGEFLAGFYVRGCPGFEDWTSTERERLHHVVLDAVGGLVADLIEQRRYQDGITYASRMLGLDPLMEEAHRQMMRLLAYSGQRGAALAQYETCRQVLADELGVEPTEETTTLYEQIQAGELERPPPVDKRPALVSPARTVRGYELLERIGTGGFGEVYRARQPSVFRQVAVKIILPQYANQPEFIRRFEREAQLVARLEHPHIVPLYDYWREPDGAFLVMRFLRGGNLRQAFQRGAWSPDAAAQLLDQVAGALTVAHRQGVVHRDVKPENILLDEEGNAYLSDFGIAKDLLRTVGATESGAIPGSLWYISPEQAQSQPVTPQSDLYSLGVVMYHVLTGKHPYSDSTPADQLVRRLTEPLPLLREHRPDLPAALEDVIQQATTQEPAQRYPSVLAFAAAFREAVSPAAVASAPTPDWAALEMVNPYKGLRPFEEADADDFFGREALTEGLLARLAPSPSEGEGRGGGEHPELVAGRFLAVVGPSGCGKSSVVKAGLLPALRRGAVPGSQDWYIVEMLPGAHPLDELEIGLLRIAVSRPPGLMEQLQRDERGLLRAARLVLPTRDANQGWADHGRSELLLVIDQFEELFTRAADRDESEHLLASLYAAVSDPRSRVRVVITLRADFYDRPLMRPDFGRLMRECTEVVVPLTAEELAQAIREPAQRAGAELESGLVTAIVTDVSEQPGALPMLQYALTELFERREGRALTHQAYQEIGGVSGALAQRAEGVYAGLEAAEQTASRQLFLRLVTLGEGTEDTRRRVLRSELEALTTDDDGRRTKDEQEVHDSSLVVGPSSAMARVIDRYGRHRLLTFDRDPATREPTVEVAHEALLREWRRLGAWLEESRADVRYQRLLAAAAGEWGAADRDTSFLLRGSRLAGFEGWAAESAVALTQDERAFLEASIAQRERRQAERERLRRRVTLGLTVGLAIALILTALAGLQWRRAEEEQRVALDAQAVAAAERDQAQTALARLLAMQALARLEDDRLDLALLLSVESFRTADIWEAKNSLRTALQYNPPLVTFLRGHAGPGDGTSVQWETATGVESVAFSFDGQTLASGDEDGTIILWDAETGTVKSHLTGHTGRVSGLAFSPRCVSPPGAAAERCGQTLASGSWDRTVILWDGTTGQPTGPALAHTASVWSVAFSPDGNTLAWGDEDGAITLWDVDTGSVQSRLAGHTAAVREVVFSPDGRTLASGGNDRAVILWDVATGQPVGPSLTGHTGWVSSVAFSPDGRTLASGGADGTVILWDVATRRAIGSPLTDHADKVLGVAFSPAGLTLASSSADGTVILWDVPERQMLGSLTGHADEVSSVAFSPDGQTLASGSADGIVILWKVANLETGLRENDLPPPDPLDIGHIGLTDQARRVAFSPDGRMAASASDDGVLRLWDMATGELLRSFSPGHKGRTSPLVFSPDGGTLASAGRDGAIILSDVANGSTQGRLTGHTLVWSMAFDPDGGILASTGSPEGTIMLWDLSTHEPLGPALVGHTGWVISVAFSPDGGTLASGGDDHTVILWDVATGQPLGPPLTAHTKAVYALAFSPEGGTLAAGHVDGPITLWDVVTGSAKGRLDQSRPIGLGASSGTGVRLAYRLAFSPDGGTLAADGCADSPLQSCPIQLWDVAAGRPIGPPLTGHTVIEGLAFGPDGSALAAGGRTASRSGGGNAIILWDVSFESWQARACRRANRNLTPAEWEQFFGDQPYRKTCPDLP